MEPQELTIEAASAKLAQGQLSAVELVSSCLDRIEGLNADLNAFIHLRSRKELLEEAQLADKRRQAGQRLGPLDGIPIGLKANYAYAGLPTTAGSKILAEWRPKKDAVAVANLRRAGAVILGMLNMHEFADGPTNENPHYGRALNPHDMSRMPGGSSGGSAVALATNMCLGATGSDTGGSIRIPSALCGTVGLKPTYGLVSVEGVVPFSRSLDHAGPMARTPHDALLLLRGMTGDGDVAGRPSTAIGERDQIVVGVERDYFGRYLQSGVRRAFDNAIDSLRKIGYQIREIHLDHVPRAGAAELAILFPEAAAVHHHFLNTRIQDYGRDVRLSLLSGRLYRAVDYVNAQELRGNLRSDLDAVFEQATIVATPTTVLEAPTWDTEFIQTDEGEVELLEALIRCTAPFNLTGHPAMSVPCGVGDEGLPVGLQLVGPALSEALLADLATAFLSANLNAE